MATDGITRLPITLGNSITITAVGNVSIGLISPNYKLDVNGSLNSTSLYQNGTLINFSSYATKATDIINTSNYVSNISNVLLNTIPINIYNNLNIYSEKLYPPKLYNNYTNPNIVNYLTQISIYKETITLDTTDITYGNGTYEIYSSSSNNQPYITIPSGSYTTDIVSNDASYNYISFLTSGTLNLSCSLLNCDILVVGGGGAGSAGGNYGGNGGGAGAVVYIQNVTIPSGSYSILIGNGGAGATTYNGSDINDGGASYFGNIKAAGGGGASGRNGGSGSGGGGIALASLSSLGNYSTGTIYGKNGSGYGDGNGLGGGGGAGSAGNGRQPNNNGGAGGNGIQINITGTNTYYGGGGGTSFGGAGGLGGGGSENTSYNAINNTGGGGCGTYATITSGKGGSGIVIIKYPNNLSNKKLLFNNNIYNDIILFKVNNYNTSGDYIATPSNYIISGYNGDWIIIKFANLISLSRYNIYINPIYINNAPSLWKLYGSIDGTSYVEIVELSNNLELTNINYLQNNYQISVSTSNILNSYLYYGIVIKKIIGNGTSLHISQLQFYARDNILNNTKNSVITGETINTSSNLQEKGINLSSKYLQLSGGTLLGTLTGTTINTQNLLINNNNITNIITNTSNYASNISNVIITNSSNYASNISNVVLANSSNYTSNVSNVIITNSSNYASNISNVIITNNSNYASNISNVIITNSSNYASNISNVIITNTSNYTSNVSNILLTTFKYNSPLSTDVNNIISLNLDNQNIIRYPPAAMSALTNTYLSLNYYNNGTYTVSSSTNNSTSFYCFNYDDLINEWTASASSYRSTAPFDYYPTSINTIINGINNYGEWVQLYYDKGFVANRIDIVGINANNIKCPSAFIVAGSINGSYWTLLSRQSGITTYNTSNIFYISNYTSYNYYRTIFTNTIGSQTLGITEIKLYGMQNSTYINNDNFNQNIYNTNEKQFPPRLYDTSSPETNYTPTTGDELFGLNPTTIYKQTISLNNHGNYTIYSSSTTNDINHLKNLLFNFNSADSEGAHWGANNYNASGVSNKLTCIKADYTGDWIIIKLPYKIVLTKFRFYNRSALIDRAPGRWKCYGSNDGINFTEITEAGNVQTNLTVSNYALGYYEDIIPSIFDIPYLYIGWVVKQLVGAVTILNFNELQIFGKDDITSSYSKALTLLSDNTLIYNNPSTITTYTSTTSGLNLINKYVRFNYDEEVYINSLESTSLTLTFTSGTHTLNTLNSITKYTYPILKDSSSNIINPLIWYKFNTSPGITIDSGSLNNGSLTNNGPVLINTTVGNYIHGNGSAELNSSSKYLTIQGNIDLNAINLATGISISFWVKITSSITGSNARIFDFGRINVNNGENYIMISSDGTDGRLKFEIYNNITKIAYLTASAYNNSTFINICWIITTTGNWSIYINNTSLLLTNQTQTGSLIGSGSLPRLIPSVAFADRKYYIGKSLFSADGYFNMFIDDFRIYGKELTTNEIAELYNGRVEVYNKKNIGIGITNPNPNYILDVNGNANISGNISGNNIICSNVGIGTTTPTNILQIGKGGRLRIANGINDFTQIGTEDEIYNVTNAKIFISGNTYSDAGNNGGIQYFATGTIGRHIFYTTNANTERMRISSDGNVGIGTEATAKLHIYYTSSISGDFLPSNGGLYVYNPNNTSTSYSSICTRIGGTAANKAIYSLDVNTAYGWSIYINGNDTSNKLLRFNPSWNANPTISDILTLSQSGVATLNGSLTTTGNVGIGTATPNTKLHIENNSLSFSQSTGGLYVYNPTNEGTKHSLIGVANGGTSAGKVGISLGIGSTGTTGWSMYTTGTDTSTKTLYFNSTSDTSGNNQLSIRGTDGYTSISGSAIIGSGKNDAILTIGNSTSATTLILSNISTATWKIATGNQNLTFKSDFPIGGTFVDKIILSKDGSVGIGTTSPIAFLHLHSNVAATEIALKISDGTTGATATDGFSIIKQTNQDIVLRNYENTRMVFMTNNNQRMSISAAGNVCIGIPQADNIFQVGAGGRLRIANDNLDYTLIGTLNTDDPTTNTRIVISGNLRAAPYKGDIEYITTTTDGFHDFKNGATSLAQITSEGNISLIGNLKINNTSTGNPTIGINGSTGDKIILLSGTASVHPYSIGIASLTMWFSVPLNGLYNWYVNGNIIMNLTTTGQLTTLDDVIGFGSLSDKRLKTNINDLSINCLELINNIKSVEFNWIDNERIPERKKNTKDHGFIAQDIEVLLPNLINNEGIYKSLKYEKFAPYFVKGIQELYKIIQEQKNEIKDLQNQITSIKQYLNI